MGGTLVDTKPNGREMVGRARRRFRRRAPPRCSPRRTRRRLGVQDFSPALPTASGATNTVLNGMDNNASADVPDTYAFFFANPTTMFVADATLGLQEWTLSSGSWSDVATLSGSYVGLTGVQNGNGTVSLYATTGTAAATGRVNGNSLISDTFTYNSGNSGTGTFGTPTTLATAGADYGFAGVALAPQAPNVDLVVSSSSGSTTAGTPGDRHRHGPVHQRPRCRPDGHRLHRHDRHDLERPATPASGYQTITPSRPATAAR